MYKHAHSGGLRFMDYDADSTAGGLTINSLRFPSNGFGGVTETFSESDVYSRLATLHMIAIVTAAGATQLMTVRGGDTTQFIGWNIETTTAINTIFFPVMQTGTVIIGAFDPATGLTEWPPHGLELPQGGFGIQIGIGAASSNLVKARVWYSVV